MISSSSLHPYPVFPVLKNALPQVYHFSIRIFLAVESE